MAETARQYRHSHMRKVLEALAIADRERYEQHFEAARSPWVKRLLKLREATRFLDAWRNKPNAQARIEQIRLPFA